MYFMSDVSRTTPRKVLRLASERGVHTDCVAADYGGACDSCIDIFNEVFYELYGDSKDAAEYIFRITDDLLQDREND